MVEAEGRNTLAADVDGLAHPAVGVGSEDRGAAGSLHVEMAPVGGEADLHELAHSQTYPSRPLIARIAKRRDLSEG